MFMNSPTFTLFGLTSPLYPEVSLVNILIVCIAIYYVFISVNVNDRGQII